MPEKKTRARAQAAKKRGNAPSTQAGEYVRQEIHHIREGKHGAKNTKQAIAIGLSEARRDGVKVPPRKGTKDKGEESKGAHAQKKVSAKRSAGAKRALKRQPHAAASHRALSRHAKKAARSQK